MNKPKKCKSCGRIISNDLNSISYSPNPNAKYCLRCWNLKQYSKNTHEKLATEIANANVKSLEIKSDDLVILINDLFNINFDLIKQYANYEQKVLVFNKIDLVLNQHNYSIIVKNIEQMLKNMNCKYQKILLTSAKNNYGIRSLNDVIIHQQLKTKIYFIGDTNAGKSSLINQLLNYNGLRNKELTISPYLNTTIDYKKVKILKHSIIDCPGSNDQSSIINAIISPSSKLTNLKKINSMFYQINKEQYFYFENLGYIKITPKENTSVAFYINLNIKISRTTHPLKIVPNEIQLNPEFPIHAQTFTNPNKMSAIQVSGLGHIYVKNAKIIELTLPSNVKVNLWNNRIC